MAKAREIKKRMKAVGNIKRITKTMQMIATGKFAKSQQRALATKPYTEGVFDLVTELAAKAGNISHPLIEGPDGGPRGPHLVLTLTSDRGLCGAYNGAVLRAAVAHMREAKAAGRNIIREIVGKKGAAFFRFNQFEVAAAHTFGDQPRFEEVERLAQDYMDRFVAGQIASVRIVYMRFISTARQRPEVLQLLPLKPPAPEEGDAPAPASSSVDYEFSPSPEELLNDLLPVTVKTTLFQCINDAVVSEQIARMVAMKAATDNAGKMGKSLSRQYNRARQSQITTELTEIISGAAALE
ncbi:MAG: ATP synthase F1 subunit gamma [Phycisphaerales bacterium]